MQDLVEKPLRTAPVGEDLQAVAIIILPLDMLGIVWRLIKCALFAVAVHSIVDTLPYQRST